MKEFHRSADLSSGGKSSFPHFLCIPLKLNDLKVLVIFTAVGDLWGSNENQLLSNYLVQSSSVWLNFGGPVIYVLLFSLDFCVSASRPSLSYKIKLNMR